MRVIGEGGGKKGNCREDQEVSFYEFTKGRGMREAGSK